jgi:hypothetical protein
MSVFYFVKIEKSNLLPSILTSHWGFEQKILRSLLQTSIKLYFDLFFLIKPSVKLYFEAMTLPF